MPVVVFDPTAFKTRYPEFTNVPDAQLGLCFDEAGLYLSNANNSPVQNLTRRAMLLNMLTAHVAWLAGKLSADGQAKPVGRISNASEGSVSAAFEYGLPGTKEWFVQTQYGASFWQATTALRGFRYVARPTLY